MVPGSHRREGSWAPPPASLLSPHSTHATPDPPLRPLSRRSPRPSGCWAAPGTAQAEANWRLPDLTPAERAAGAGHQPRASGSPCPAVVNRRAGAQTRSVDHGDGAAKAHVAEPPRPHAGLPALPCLRCRQSPWGPSKAPEPVLWPASALSGSTCSAAATGYPQLRSPPQRSRRASVRTPSALPSKALAWHLGRAPR